MVPPGQSVPSLLSRWFRGSAAYNIDRIHVRAYVRGNGHICEIG